MNYNWDDNKVIDFVNWYLELHNLPFQYTLENITIIDSFKNGDNVSLWKNSKLKELSNESTDLKSRVDESFYESEAFSNYMKKHPEAKGIDAIQFLEDENNKLFTIDMIKFLEDEMKKDFPPSL